METDPVSEKLRSLKYRTINKVQKPSNPLCCTSSSEPLTDLYRLFTAISNAVLFKCRKSAPNAKGMPMLFPLQSSNEPQHYPKQHVSISIEHSVVSVSIDFYSLYFRKHGCVLSGLIYSLAMNMQISGHNVDNGRFQLLSAPVALDCYERTFLQMIG
jgi:hypothetical protein